MVKFLFSVHTITEAKQSTRQGGARAVDLPGAPWCSAATVCLFYSIMSDAPRVEYLSDCAHGFRRQCVSPKT